CELDVTYCNCHKDKIERPKEDENPFNDLKISDWKILDDISERQLCQVCNKSRKYFCYNCYVPVPDLQDRVPKVKLPVKIDIIKHSREIDGKSTAAHAAVLAPEDVNIYTYPCIPDYGPSERVVLIFPGKNAVSVENYILSSRVDREETEEPRPKRLNSGSNLPITRAVFIDSTWNQSRGIYKDQRLRDLPCVILQSRISQFWRHQNGSPRWYLATIEAIHQFLLELHTAVWKLSSGGFNITNNTDDIEKRTVPSSADKCDNVDENVTKNSKKEPSTFSNVDTMCSPYSGEYDNLLFFFRYMYSKIHTLYDHEDLKAYKRPLT
ncbi:hypothetical protein L9F63_024976, partial [Diploptera punctata]